MTAAALLTISWVLIVPTAGAAAPRESDVGHLTAGLPPGFQRTEVIVYPLLDQAALAQDVPRATGATAPPPAFAAFVRALQRHDNLDVVPPAAAQRRITRAVGYERSLGLADELRALGEEEYRAVRLESAARRFDAAAKAYLDLGYDLIAPQTVGRTLLFQGLAQLESGDRFAAEQTLRRALMVDPTVRLRSGFDRPESVAALERARLALLGAGPPAPPTFALTGGAYGTRGRRTWVIFARRLGDRLELAIHGPQGVSLEVQALGGDPADAGERLASRVFACLPFGAPPEVPGHRPQLYLDAGFAGFAWVQSPVEVFSNLGVALNLSWVAAPHLAIDLNASLTNSGRDREEDLRADVATVRVWAGPGFSWGNDRLRASAHVGVEVATPSEVLTTTDADCKFHGPDDRVPAALCDLDRDLDSVPRAILVGPTLVLGGTVRLVNQIFLGVRVQGANYLYRSEDAGLGWPIGAQVALGYRLY